MILLLSLQQWIKPRREDFLLEELPSIPVQWVAGLCSVHLVSRTLTDSLNVGARLLAIDKGDTGCCREQGNTTKEILPWYLASQCGLKQKISSPFKLLLSLPAIISLLADSFSPATAAAAAEEEKKEEATALGQKSVICAGDFFHQIRDIIARIAEKKARLIFNSLLCLLRHR